MRFVARRFGPGDVFLDIGSGSGANADELRVRGFIVVTLDNGVKADFMTDIRKAHFNPETFNCVLDINTLCHVEDPPFENIKAWLKPHGSFFSICPTLDTSDRVKDGKDYTRLVSEHDLRGMLRMFSEVKIGTAHYQIPGSDYFDSWIVEAKR
jgi:2-polyprenyl-3-methyl-5-hydroxy-6-metoxy-1,4-benzoquinol methylase